MRIRMRTENFGLGRRRTWLALVCGLAAFCGTIDAPRADTVASLLGNFTINQYCGLNLASDTVAVHYAAVFGQLPALGELHAADTDGNGVTTQAERDAYVGRLTAGLAQGLVLKVDGVPLPLHAVRWTSSLPQEQGGFSLRVDVEFEAALPATVTAPAGASASEAGAAGSILPSAAAQLDAPSFHGPSTGSAVPTPRTRDSTSNRSDLNAHVLTFSNDNYAGRLGWHEIVVQAAAPAIYDTNAYSSSLTGGLTEALQSLPAAGPLDERQVHLHFTSGALPVGATPLTDRNGRPAVLAESNERQIHPGMTARGARTGATPLTDSDDQARVLAERNDTAGTPVPATPSWNGSGAAHSRAIGATSRIAMNSEADTGASASGGAGTSNSGMAAVESAWIARQTRHLVDAISAPRVAPGVALAALLGALLLGAVHALSPGHGKTIVGAYLIGSRGTARHAAFLGLTVTVTHTLGVVVLGFATLYASRFIVPERLFPVLSAISAVLVLGMGSWLLLQRLRSLKSAGSLTRSDRPEPIHRPDAVFQYCGAGESAVARPLLFPPWNGGGSHSQRVAMHGHGANVHSHSHDGAMHSHDGTILSHDGAMHGHGGATPSRGAMHSHAQHVHAQGGGMHSHGGRLHSHLPPGAAGEKITWSSLVTLGVSGGLVPCPSAMVLLLAAVALNKTAYGMLLVLAFSLGLALTLTAVGLIFLHARNRLPSQSGARWQQLLPVASAAAITLFGVVLCAAALRSFTVTG